MSHPGVLEPMGAESRQEQRRVSPRWERPEHREALPLEAQPLASALEVLLRLGEARQGVSLPEEQLAELAQAWGSPPEERPGHEPLA